MSISLGLLVSIFQPVFLSICLSLPSVSPPVSQSLCLYLSVCLYPYFTTYLSISLTTKVSVSELVLQRVKESPHPTMVFNFRRTKWTRIASICIFLSLFGGGFFFLFQGCKSLYFQSWQFSQMITQNTRVKKLKYLLK